MNVQLWDSFEQLQEARKSSGRFFFLTTKSDRPYYDVEFQAGDFLVFGRETKGLKAANAEGEPSALAPRHIIA